MNYTDELIQRSRQGDERAKEQLILENNGLIWSVVRRFMGRGTEADDLYQLGCLGFLKAIDGFDSQFGTQFSTYAVPKIAGEIRRFLRDDGAVKVSRSIKEQAYTIRCAQNALTLTLGRQPTISEISKQINLSEEEIAFVENATAAVESIQQRTGEEGFCLESILADTQTEEMMMDSIALRQAIGKLQEKEAAVINLRYFHGMTQERIARILNVSQVQISRIEKRALIKLKDLLK